jgi:outer membrane protein assembly factor BamD (BamD/ComL family)
MVVTTLRQPGRRLPSGLLLAGLCALAVSGGCTWDRWHLFTPPDAPPGPADDLVLRGDKLEPETSTAQLKGAAELAGAHELYREGDFVNAEKLFHHVADNTKNAPQVAEEARYYEAESLRHQERYPKASDVYNKLLTDFPSGIHREQAVERKFEIANFWLEDTREEIREYREHRDGKRWLVMPASFVHVEKSKPLLDEEGRALENLDQVTLNDINGRRADEAMFLAGSVKFFREDYREADRYFSQLVEMYPNSKFAAQAVELAIIAKHMSTGGSDYDGRKVAEARKLVDSALRNYPELAAHKSEFLNRQLYGINLQQAEKDFKVAEFYRHTGHPGAAYFYYEIVRRRYPGSPFYDKATERMHELRAKLDKTGGPAAAVAASPGAPKSSGASVLPPVPINEVSNQPEQAPPPRKLPPTAPLEETPLPRSLPSGTSTPP